MTFQQSAQRVREKIVDANTQDKAPMSAEQARALAWFDKQVSHLQVSHLEDEKKKLGLK